MAGRRQKPFNQLQDQRPSRQPGAKARAYWDQHRLAQAARPKAECSFCLSDASQLVAGAGRVYICAECLETASEMVKG